MRVATPIKITTQNRRTPYLQAYLQHLIYYADGRAMTIGGLVTAGIGALGCAITALLFGLGVLEPGPGLWVMTNVFGLPLVGGVAMFLWGRNKRLNRGEDNLYREAREVGNKLNASLSQRRLYREMHPAALELLEESSRCWKRVHDTIDGAFWKSAELPAHYQGVRQQARASADRAMMEILLNLRSAVKPIGQPQTFVEGLQTFLDAIGISLTDQATNEPLPEGFTAAAVLSKGLSELASEIEKTSIQAIKSSAPASIDSGENIRQTLEELKQIRAAESEIDQELQARS